MVLVFCQKDNRVQTWQKLLVPLCLKKEKKKQNTIFSWNFLWKSEISSTIRFSSLLHLCKQADWLINKSEDTFDTSWWQLSPWIISSIHFYEEPSCLGHFRWSVLFTTSVFILWQITGVGDCRSINFNRALLESYFNPRLYH